MCNKLLPGELGGPPARGWPGGDGGSLGFALLPKTRRFAG